MKDVITDTLRKFKDRADYLEIRTESRRVLNLGADKTGLVHISRTESTGGCVRAYLRGGWGFASFESLDRLSQYVEKAIAWARLSSRGKCELASVPVVTEDVPLKALVHPDDVSLEVKVRYLLDWCDRVLSYGGHVVDSMARYHDSVRVLTFGNSEGSLVEQEVLDSAAAVQVLAKNGSVVIRNQLSDGSSNTFTYMDSLSSRLAEHIATSNALASADSIRSGQRDVVLNPDMTGVFTHEAFGHTIEADHFANDPKAANVLRLGRRLAKPIVNIFDSGTSVGHRGFLAFDDEGVRARETQVLTEGVITAHLHSRETAGLMGEEPTGNARAISYQFQPIVRMRNTYIANGMSSLDELIGDIDDGIYVINSAGGSTDGEKFQFLAQYGRRIEKGKLGAVVRDISLLGNLFRTLWAIDGVGNDFQTPDGAGGCGKRGQYPLPVTHGGPHIRIRKCMVGGKA
jgi:predicted Zn-dependent protease